MESSKLKNIAILILVMTNVFLLAITLRREYQGSGYQSRTLDDAVRLLAAQGISVDARSVPDAGYLIPQSMPRDLTKEQTLARELLGDRMQTEVTGAEVYRYSSEKGFLQFHSSGAFFGEFERGIFPVGEDPVSDCRDILNRLGYQGELTVRTENSCTFRQIWKEVPLFSQEITMAVGDGSLIGLSARQQLVGDLSPDLSRQTVSTATALISFLNGVRTLGDVCSRVDAITAGYVGTVTLSGIMVLTPVWAITTDTGAYQLDLVTGELTRLVQEGPGTV